MEMCVEMKETRIHKLKMQQHAQVHRESNERDETRLMALNHAVTFFLVLVK